MKRRNRLSKWVALAVTGLGGVSLVAMVAMMAVTGVSLMTPDTAFAKFDMSKLTVSGDIRVRGEYRHRGAFGDDPDVRAKNNDQAILQRTRLGVGYQTSPDVSYFMQIQDSRIWGRNDVSDDGAVNSQNNPAQTIGLRQGIITIKNAGMKNLSLKLGRQRIVLGGQRLMGHFDWDNNGWSFDGVRADYSSKLGNTMFAWLRVVETDGAFLNSGGIGRSGLTGGSQDEDLYIIYNTLKMIPGMTIEPYWMGLFDGQVAAAAATTKDGRSAKDQKRHYLGVRVVGKAMKKMIDYTAEGVWQTGQQKDDAQKQQTINAWATAITVGVTLPVPMKPRIGLEYDYASGSAPDAEDSGGRHTFDGLWPTNHLYYGYMDNFAWKNMVDYVGQFSLKPTKTSKVKVHFHVLRLAQAGDNWYQANQKKLATTRPGNTQKSIGQELDVIVSKKFKNGKVGLTVGYGHFFAGAYMTEANNGAFVERQGGTGVGTTDSDWGYVSVSHKF